MKPDDIKNILIIQTAFIGDVILTTPLIGESKRIFPNANIDVMAIPQTASVLQNNPNIRSILIFDKRAQKIHAFIKMVRTIRKKNYDIGFAAHRSMTTAWLMIFGGIKNRIGLTGKSAARLMSKRVQFRQSARQIERYLDLLGSLTDEALDAQSHLFFNTQINEQVKALLSTRTKNFPTIAVAPGSVRETKKWPEERFTTVLRMLKKMKTNIILIGSPGEKELCDRIAASIQSPALINLAGKTSLLEAAAVIKECELLVCNDSGTMHMANAVETDVFAFFGPTMEWFGFSPFRPNDKIFQVDLECRPCGRHGGKTCPEGHFRCMLDIDVNHVFQSIVKKLDLKEASEPNLPGELAD